MKNKINFKQPKYILPLVAFPFIMLFGYFLSSFNQKINSDKNELATSKNISTELGAQETEQTKIKEKTAAYQEFFENRADGKTMISGLEEETDTLEQFSDNLTKKEKRTIDSIKATQEEERIKKLKRQIKVQQNYYTSPINKNKTNEKPKEEDQYERSMRLIELMNKQDKPEKTEEKKSNSWQNDQLSLMRQQMLLMDSIEKSNNPEIKEQARVEREMKLNQQKYQNFLNSTYEVTKAAKNANFNSIYKEKENSFITAVIDENIKGYMGSRLRIRLLEDIYVGKQKIIKGTSLYALISGFSLQRVNLNIVSIMYQNEILPINLNIYDIDGMEGLYVPSSAFREMTRKMGENAVQGQNLNLANGNLFQTTLSQLFNSTSKTISDLIRKNKVKIKYNSIVYLIDNKDLIKKNQNIYKQD